MTYSIISQSIYYVYPLLACVSDTRLKKWVNSPPTGRPAVTCDRHLAIGQSTGHRCNTGDVDAQGAPWAGSATFWCCHFEFCFIHVLYRSSSVDCHDSWLMYDSMVCFTVVRDSWETVFLSPHNGTLSFAGLLEIFHPDFWGGMRWCDRPGDPTDLASWNLACKCGTERDGRCLVASNAGRNGWWKNGCNMLHIVNLIFILAHIFWTFRILYGPSFRSQSYWMDDHTPSIPCCWVTCFQGGPPTGVFGRGPLGMRSHWNRAVWCRLYLAALA